ncbi:MAG: tetratricopeptide repeat protein [Nitrospirota bacterium]
MTTRPRAAWFALGLVMAVTIFAYRGVVANGFVVDDIHAVRDNPAVSSLRHIGTWFTSPYAVSGQRGIQNYRPVTVASYALDHAVWGEGPAGFHATNLLIHLGVVALTFVLARRLWNDDWAAVGAAAVLALHPLNAEAVNYISARSSSLMTLAILAAVWAWDRASASRHWGWTAVAMTFGLSALGAKEAAIVLPALIIAWDRARTDGTAPLATTMRRSWAWWALGGAFLALRSWVLDGGHAMSTAGAGAAGWQGAVLALKISLASVGHWVWPAGLAVDHAWPVTVRGWEAGLLIAGAAAAGLVTFAVARRDRRLGWCAAWCWIALLPMWALPFVTRLMLYQDHRVYLAGIGLAWCAGWGLARVMRGPGVAMGWRVVRYGAMGVLVASAVWATVGRTAVWGDASRLWDDVLTKYPDSAMAYNAKGMLLMDAGRLDEAQRALESAVRLAPGLSTAHSNLGVLFTRLGDWERAVASFELALRLHPSSSFVQLHLAESYTHLGRADAALALYERVLRSDPEWSTAWVRSGALLDRQGRRDDAMARYRRALHIDPNDDEARVALGAALLDTAQWGDARALFTAVLARHPDSAAARYYIGVTHAREGRDDLAEPFFREAALADPADVDARLELALLAARLGRWAEAAEWSNGVLALAPAHAVAHFVAAGAGERLGQTESALAHYRIVLRAPVSDAAGPTLRDAARAAINRLEGRRRSGAGGGGRDAS